MTRFLRELFLVVGALALVYFGLGLTWPAREVAAGTTKVSSPGNVVAGVRPAAASPVAAATVPVPPMATLSTALTTAACGGSEPTPADSELLSRQAAEYEARRPKSILALQEFRRTSSMRVKAPGGRDGVATLVDLNPRINDWYVLGLRWSGGEETFLHLENARPDRQRLVLDPAFPSGLVVEGADGKRPCEMWSDRFPNLVRDAARARKPYVDLCGGDVLVRHRTRGVANRA